MYVIIYLFCGNAIDECLRFKCMGFRFSTMKCFILRVTQALESVLFLWLKREENIFHSSFGVTYKYINLLVAAVLLKSRR